MKRWLLAALLAGLAPAVSLADTPQVLVRVGNHDGYGRIVYYLPSGTGYSVTQDGQHVVLRFTAELVVGRAAAMPRNVLGITGGSNQAELVLAPGAALHDWRLGDLVVIDVLDPTGDKTAGAGVTGAPKPSGPATAAPAAQPASPPDKATPAATPPPKPPEPVAAAPTIQPAPPPDKPTPAVTPPPKPETPAAQPEPSQTAGAPPASSPSEPPTPPAPLPLAAAPDGLVITGDAQLGVAAFRRGKNALIVFDEPRTIDVTLLQDDLVFGTATVQVLPASTVVRVQIDPGLALSVSRTGDTWRIVSSPGEPALRPIQAGVADQRLVLPAASPGSVVSVTDPDTGATLLVGTQRSSGQGVPVPRRSPEFVLLPTWQGVAVQANADTVVLRPTSDGFAVAGVANLSPQSDSVEHLARATGLTRQFDFPDQPVAALQAKLRRQVADAASAPPLARSSFRVAGARTMIALGLGAEASALLRLAAADDPNQATSADNSALTGIAALLARRPDEAAGLEDPQLPATDDIALWRAIAQAERQEGSPQAAAVFAATLPLLLAYPPQIRDRMLPMAAETLVAGGELAAAAGLLDPRKDDRTLDLARAMLHAARHETAEALADYDRLTQSSDRLVHARAAVRAIELRLAIGAMDAKQAADRLESLLYAWRGDQRERALRERLAELKARNGDWRSALNLLRDTEALFPDDKATLHAELTDKFAALLRGDTADAMAPLEFVTIIEENADLLPSGPGGDALQAKLADRLVALDLPKRAGPLLEKLAQAASTGAARAGFGARLADLRLRDGDATGALAALDASVADDLPAELVERRTLLVAAAQARRGDNEHALAVLGTLDTAAADEARATILERANDWPAAQRALAAYTAKTVPAEGALNDTQRRALLRLATAAARAGDDAGLATLRAQENSRMQSGPLADMFRLLTADPVRSVADLKRSGQEATLARQLPGQLKALTPPAGQTP